MTIFTKSTLSAVAAAIAAAAVLTTAAIPAQAEYQRAPTRTIMKKVKKLYALNCLASKGDVVAQPLVNNTTGKILPIGAKIQWRAVMANRSIKVGTYTLTSPLYAGQSRRIPATLHWKFTCKAKVFA